jgi:predicted XRE-type DNA-binding protein
MSQNLFELFTDDPVEYNMKHFKTQLLMVLIQLIRAKGWTQAEAARELKVGKSRMSNLFTGKLERFSVDTLLEMLVRSGYKLDADFDPTNVKVPLIINLKKS